MSPTRTRFLRASIALVVGVGALLGSAAARAGGVQVEVTTTPDRVWVTSDAGVTVLDAWSGQTLRRLTAAHPFAFRLGASPSGVWVMSVKNGFGEGAVTRFPIDPVGGETASHLFSRPVYETAVGNRVTWALLGPRRALRLVGFDQTTMRPLATGTPAGVTLRRDLGWIATDPTGKTDGLFAIAGTDLVRVFPDGTTRRLALTESQPAGPPVVSDGSVWLADPAGVSRYDPATGKRTGRLALESAGTRLAVGGGAVWALTIRPGLPRMAVDLVRIDATSMRETGRTHLPGSPGGIAYGNGAVWVGRTDTLTVLRIDPHTLAVKRFAQLR